MQLPFLRMFFCGNARKKCLQCDSGRIAASNVNHCQIATGMMNGTPQLSLQRQQHLPASKKEKFNH
jgi:hypothetical protein